jgi:hypothetical protein
MFDLFSHKNGCCSQCRNLFTEKCKLTNNLVSPPKTLTVCVRKQTPRTLGSPSCKANFSVFDWKRREARAPLSQFRNFRPRPARNQTSLCQGRQFQAVGGSRIRHPSAHASGGTFHPRQYSHKWKLKGARACAIIMRALCTLFCNADSGSHSLFSVYFE